MKGNYAARGKLVKMADGDAVFAPAPSLSGDRRVQESREFRALWITRVTVACRARGIRYSRSFTDWLPLRRTQSQVVERTGDPHSPHLFDELVKIAQSAALRSVPLPPIDYPAIDFRASNSWT